MEADENGLTRQGCGECGWERECRRSGRGRGIDGIWLVSSFFLGGDYGRNGMRRKGGREGVFGWSASSLERRESAATLMPWRSPAFLPAPKASGSYYLRLLITDSNRSRGRGAQKTKMGEGDAQDLPLRFDELSTLASRASRLLQTRVDASQS